MIVKKRNLKKEKAITSMSDKKRPPQIYKSDKGHKLKFAGKNRKNKNPKLTG